MRIGVVSDTHIPERAPGVPEDVVKGFRGVDMILHAGDIVVDGVLEELGRIAPVEAVAGNMDPPELRSRLGQTREIEVGGFRIGLMHGRADPQTTLDMARSAFPGADCVVFGHTHRAYSERFEGRLIFNPGSPTDRRFSGGQLSYGILYIDENGIRGEIFYLQK